jgi:iron complex transport system substrate-binding protein
MRSSQRIVSLLSSATEILYLLGLGDRVVGVSHECDFPLEATTKPRVTRSHVNSSAGSLAIDEQVKSLLAEDAPLYEIDVPQLVELAPDLIVTQAQCDVCAVRYEDVLAAVAREPALQQARVVALNPHSLEDVLADIHRVAAAVDQPDISDRVVTNLRKRIDAVREQTVVLSAIQRPRVACIEWTEPLMLAANWMPELVDIAGGKHDLTQPGVHSQYSQWADLVRYNPQVVVVMPCGFDLARSLAEAASLSQRPGWKELEAVRTGRIYAVDANSYFNRSGPRLVDSLEMLASFMHPALFPIHSLPTAAWQVAC